MFHCTQLACPIVNSASMRAPCLASAHTRRAGSNRKQEGDGLMTDRRCGYTRIDKTRREDPSKVRKHRMLLLRRNAVATFSAVATPTPPPPRTHTQTCTQCSSKQREKMDQVLLPTYVKMGRAFCAAVMF